MKDFTFRLPVSDKCRQLFRRHGLAQGDAPQRGQALKIRIRLPVGVHRKFPHRNRNGGRRRLVKKLRVQRNIAVRTREFCFQLQQLRQTLRRQRIECGGVVGKYGDGAAGRFCQYRCVILHEVIQTAKIGS